MLYLVIAVLILHISLLPIVIDVFIAVNSDEDNGEIKVKLYFIPIFIKHIDLKQIKKVLDEKDIAENKDKSPDPESAMPKGKKSKLLQYFAFQIIKRIRIRYLDMSAEIGTGDSFTTAVTVGSLNILFDQLCAFCGYYDGNSVDIVPNYDTECIFMRFNGIFSLCFADIIYVMLVALSKLSQRSAARRRKYAHNNITE